MEGIDKWATWYSALREGLKFHGSCVKGNEGLLRRKGGEWCLDEAIWETISGELPQK